MKTHAEMVAAWKADPKFRKAYEALEEEFALFDELLKARSRTGLTQAEVAERMGTKTPAVARLEAGGGRKKHSPSLATLRKYAAAVGCQLEIKLVPLLQPYKQEGGNHLESRRANRIGATPAGGTARLSRLTRRWSGPATAGRSSPKRSSTV